MTSPSRDHGVMRTSQVAKALSKHDNAYQEMASILFGDGADELVAKLSPDQTDLHAKGKQDRKTRAITAGLSGVGAAAGAGGLALAGKEMRHGYKHAPKNLSRAGKLVHSAKNKKIATALLPLEAAGLGGELMATKILHGDVKKPKKVVASKSADEYKELAVPNKGKLVRTGFRKGSPQLKKVIEEYNRPGAVKQENLGKSDTEIIWEGEFSKMDTDKRQVFGWASVVEVGGEPVHDLQGDVVTGDEIEKAAYAYVQKSRKGGDNHRRAGEEPFHASDMIESFLVTPEKIEKMGLPPHALPTGWWVGFQVNDDELWSEVKKGNRSQFSIHGRGIRRPVGS